MKLALAVGISFILVVAEKRRKENCIFACAATGTACIAGCTAASVAAVWSGPVAAAGFLLCTGACQATNVACMTTCDNTENCFADNTTVFQRDSHGRYAEIFVQQVEPGAEVMAVAGDDFIWSKIMSNHRYVGNFDFTQFSFHGAQEDLIVTNNHNMMVRKSGVVRIMQAADVSPGDVLPGHRGDVEVQAVVHIPLPHKNALITESGTLVANSVQVSTLCDDPKYAQLETVAAAVQEWWRDHPSRVAEVVSLMPATNGNSQKALGTCEATLDIYAECA